MTDINRIEVNIEHIEKIVNNYIQKNFSPKFIGGGGFGMMGAVGVVGTIPFNYFNADTVNFREHFEKNKDESFSQKLLSLIKESGEKNSNIYNRANIDRRHFSKIVNHEDYQPSKQTVLAFAIALKLGFEKTKDLLASAGFTLSNSNIFDVIVSAFIENKIFDLNLINIILYKYKQPLLGS